MVMVHFARGQQKTPHMVLYQFFVAFGMVLGPAMASVSLLLLPGTETKDALANCLMVFWGAGLWAGVAIFIPRDISELEAQAGILGEQVPEAVSSPAESPKGLLEVPGTSSGLALFLTLISSATIRMAQRPDDPLGGRRER